MTVVSLKVVIEISQHLVIFKNSFFFLLIPSSVLPFQLLYSLTLTGFYIFYFFIEVLRVHPLFPPVWYLYDHYFELYQEDCLSVFCLAIFLTFCLVLSFGTYSSALLCPAFCVYFYVSGRLATFLGFESSGLCPVVSRGTISPCYQNQVFWGCPLCGLVYPLLWLSCGHCDWAGGEAGPLPSCQQ